MMTFECKETSCPNANVEYNFLGTPTKVECGGCKATLAGTNERPDPEIPAEIED
jgi:hypothetical protein